MKKWDIIENVLVEKLVFWGKGFTRLKSENVDLDWRVIFITGSAIPWEIVNLRVLKKKNDYIETQIVEIVKKSPIEKIHPNNPYWMSGGWKWINIPYEEQLKIKENQVKEAVFHLKKFQDNLENVFLPIEWSPLIDWYRNKVEFSFWKYISKREGKDEQFNVWFHKQWEFSKVEDYDGCILIDEFQNNIYREIKKFCKNSWLPVYDSMRNEGFFRHLLIRKTYFTNEMMIILWFNPNYLEKNKLNYETKKIEEFFRNLAWKYGEIKSIYLSYNSNKADIAIWDLELVYWKENICEELNWLRFNIWPKSFFQTNSSWAEKLYSIVLDFAHKEQLKDLKILDLYAWTWTIWMIFAKAWALEVMSVELVKQASENWIINAKLNWLQNMSFKCAKVEDFLQEYLNDWQTADLLVIDPPRDWMHPDALPNIINFWVKQIIYVSCNPATLARDLWYILNNSDYKIEKIKPMDMFPHTHHIETVVSLVKN